VPAGWILNGVGKVNDFIGILQRTEKFQDDLGKRNQKTNSLARLQCRAARGIEPV
jgi:hypothetical protein